MSVRVDDVEHDDVHAMVVVEDECVLEKEKEDVTMKIKLMKSQKK